MRVCVRVSIMTGLLNYYRQLVIIYLIFYNKKIISYVFFKPISKTMQIKLAREGIIYATCTRWSDPFDLVGVGEHTLRSLILGIHIWDRIVHNIVFIGSQCEWNDLSLNFSYWKYKIRPRTRLLWKKAICTNVVKMRLNALNSSQHSLWICMETISNCWWWTKQIYMVRYNDLHP